MEATPQDISQLRERFLKKLDEDGGSIPGGIHPLDLARIKDSDDWLRRFLLHNNLDPKESLNMLWDTCKWRKTFGTNEITAKNVKTEYLEDGSMFAYSQDKNGKPLFVLKSKKHVKGQRDLEELKRCMVYWFERLERQCKGDMITIFFDMADAGLSNLDMEYTQYIISLFKHYYPYFLNYILIFEMPWILNAAFKIIKTWLPEQAVQKIKFVTKNTLKEFVEPDRAMICWGGCDDYVFSFQPEEQNDQASIEERGDKLERKVHFADNQKDPSFGSESSQGLRLKITPPELIIFNSDGPELSAALSVTNMDDKIISFKIKTTSPEKYRVKPSSGVLKPGTSASVSVVVHPGFQSSTLTRDKFLFMGMPVNSADLSAQDLSEIWKRTGNRAVEYRLKCNIAGAAGDGSTKNGGPPGILSSSGNEVALLLKNMSNVMEANARIESKLLFIQQLMLMLICGLLGLAYVVYLLRDENLGETTIITDSHVEL